MSHTWQPQTFQYSTQNTHTILYQSSTKGSASLHSLRGDYRTTPNLYILSKISNTKDAYVNTSIESYKLEGSKF